MAGESVEKRGDGYIRWRCKSCGQKLKVKETYEGGHVIRCPRCRSSVTVPLANIDAIAAGTDMEETGQPGQLRVDREKLMRVLEQHRERADRIPGSQGAVPSVQGWSPEAAFGRIERLDHLFSAVNKIDTNAMGDVQRLYRNKNLSEDERRERMRDIGQGRQAEIRRLVQNRLAAVDLEVTELEKREAKLNRRRKAHLQKLRRAAEALRLYVEEVLGVDLD